MTRIKIDDLQLTTGVDIPIEELGLTIKQPLIKEISLIGEQNYFIALQIFTMSKEQLKIQDEKVTQWMIFQRLLQEQVAGITNIKVLLSNFLQLFFIRRINIGPNSLILMDKDKIVNIEPDDFPIIQKIIGEVGGQSFLTGTKQTFNPVNKRAAEIAAKMEKAHKRLNRVKSVENGFKVKSFLAKFIRIAALGTPNSLSEITNMTLLQLKDIVKMYIAKEEYDLEVKMRLVPGNKSEKKLIHWSENDPNQEQNNIEYI